MKRRTRQHGFSLLETLLAVSTLAIGMIFVGGTFLTGIYLATVSTEQTIATVVADEALVKIRLYGLDADIPADECALYTELVDIPTSEECIRMADKWDKCWTACGFHPNDLADKSISDVNVLRGFLGHEKVVAIGETGIDLYRDRVPLEKQRRFFIRHIETSLEEGYPLIVHSRNAEEETMKVIEGLQEAIEFAIINTSLGDRDQFNQVVKSFREEGRHDIAQFLIDREWRILSIGKQISSAVATAATVVRLKK